MRAFLLLILFSTVAGAELKTQLVQYQRTITVPDGIQVDDLTGEETRGTKQTPQTAYKEIMYTTTDCDAFTWDSGLVRPGLETISVARCRNIMQRTTGDPAIVGTNTVTLLPGQNVARTRATKWLVQFWLECIEARKAEELDKLPTPQQVRWWSGISIRKKN